MLPRAATHYTFCRSSEPTQCVALPLPHTAVHSLVFTVYTATIARTAGGHELPASLRLIKFTASKTKRNLLILSLWDWTKPRRAILLVPGKKDVEVGFKVTLFFLLCPLKHYFMSHKSRCCVRYKHKEMFWRLTQLEGTLSFSWTEFFPSTSSLRTQITSCSGFGCREKPECLVLSHHISSIRSMIAVCHQPSWTEALWLFKMRQEKTYF